jgi:Protein of unknown function (DUF2628)
MHDLDQLSPVWQKRFDFYLAHGLPGSTPQSKAAFKALPFVTRMRLTGNPAAFLFGPFYFFAKGMWRKGLVLLAMALVLGAAIGTLNLPEMAERAAAMVVPALAMTTANYAYYLHVTKDSRSWNPFEAMGRR